MAPPVFSPILLKRRGSPKVGTCAITLCFRTMSGFQSRALSMLAMSLALAAMSACQLPPSRTDAALTETGELVALSGGASGAANACFSCHGLQGQGDGVSVPRLAGLDAGYLQKQMEDYAADTRHHDVMSAIARRLDADSRRDVASHYAALPAPQGLGEARAAPAIWHQGDMARDVPACSSCHGMAGEGVGPGNPAVSGQPSAYTVDQLMRWKRAERRNDPRNVMSQAVAGLSGREISAIALWLETQPTSPSPTSDAASASAAAAVAAGPAASRGPRRPDR